MSKFPTTRWSLVAAAAERGADTGPALGELCKLYLSPVLAHVQRFVRRPHDAQDLTQGFFAHLVAPDGLATAHPRHGRFRTWLTRQIWSFASSERKRRRAKMRGGAAIVVSLDVLAAEGRHEPADSARTPDREYARRRTLEVLDQVMAELERTDTSPHPEHFQRLEQFLDGSEVPYKVLARDLGVAAGTLRKRVCDMRQRHRRLLRRHFKRMGVKPADIDDEIRNLFAALS